MAESVKVEFELPLEVYQQVEHMAALTENSIAATLAEAVSKGVDNQVQGEIPDDISLAVATLPTKSNTVLWRIARAEVSAKAHERIERLSAKRSDKGLTQNEEIELAKLLHKSRYIMLTRAKAALLLKQRGYSIDTLIS